MRSTYRPAAAPINVAPISDTDFAIKYARCVRHGKTRRDHESGSWKSRFANRARRVEIQQSSSRKV
jgi:hypothetical protein